MQNAEDEMEQAILADRLLEIEQIHDRELKAIADAKKIQFGFADDVVAEEEQKEAENE